MTVAQPSSLQLAVQPYLNQWGPWRLTRDEITLTAIQRYCEVAEDANSMYWDEEFARTTRFGRIIAPPQGLFSFSFAPWWTPDYVAHRTGEDAARLNPPGTPSGREVMQLVNDHGYTVATVQGQEAEYLAPFGPGDGRLKMRGMTLEISLEKQTRPGKGVFITSVTEYHTEREDRLVARSRMVLLMYNPTRPGSQPRT